jgi:hypothetical protein
MSHYRAADLALAVKLLAQLIKFSSSLARWKDTGRIRH